MAKPKLFIHVPSLPQKSYEYRRGDSILIYDEDGKAVLIDGGEGELYTKMEAFLKSKKIRNVTFLLTHWHPDHDCGLKAALNSPWVIVDEIYCPPISELKLLPKGDGYSDYSRAVKIIGLAKELDKKIIEIPHGKKVGHWVGKIRMWMYREKANPSYPADYQVNCTSIQTFFPDLGFLSGGDMISGKIKYLKKYPSYKIVGFSVDHHGNSEGHDTCKLLKQMGAKICFYSDFEPSGTAIGCTNFSKYGAGRTKQYFETLRMFNDIDVTADGAGHVIWKQGKNTWTYAVDYGSAAATVPNNNTSAPELRDMSELFVIDVGYSQGVIDWDKVANNIDCAILECGYGQDRTDQDDKQFERNCSECERLGIPYGIYLYSYALNSSRASGEADHALRLAKGKQLSLPIYYDLEESKNGNVAASNMETFGKKVEAAGYWCGLYSGEYYYNKNLSTVTRFTKWIAKYGQNNGKQGTKPNVKNVAIWQYSSKGRISGITGNVDVNVMYGDSLLKGVTGKDYIQAAKDVWSGKYGVGDERTKALAEKGLDPRIVQHFVNRLAK